VFSVSLMPATLIWVWISSFLLDYCAPFLHLWDSYTIPYSQWFENHRTVTFVIVLSLLLSLLLSLAFSHMQLRTVWEFGIQLLGYNWYICSKFSAHKHRALLDSKCFPMMLISKLTSPYTVHIFILHLVSFKNVFYGTYWSFSYTVRLWIFRAANPNHFANCMFRWILRSITVSGIPCREKLLLR